MIASADRDLDLRFGIDYPLQALVVPPFFDEMNRCRRLIATVMRGLADRGIGSRLPDLPGTGEAPGEPSFAAWRQAIVERPATFTIAFRGGALIDDALEAPHWRFSPVDGAALTRDLRRAQHLAGGETFAGWMLPPPLLTTLDAAVPTGSARVLRLESDRTPADRHVAGTPLWRRAEPGDDPGLAMILVDDILSWSRTCARF